MYSTAIYVLRALACAEHPKVCVWGHKEPCDARRPKYGVNRMIPRVGGSSLPSQKPTFLCFVFKYLGVLSWSEVTEVSAVFICGKKEGSFSLTWNWLWLDCFCAFCKFTISSYANKGFVQTKLENHQGKVSALIISLFFDSLVLFISHICYWPVNSIHFTNELYRSRCSSYN